MSLRRLATDILANQRSLGCLNAFVGRANNRKELNSTGKHRASPEGATKSAVDGRLISVKDNICTKVEPTTCASAILHNYQSPYAATVVSRLEAAGALINGKTNLDEFGMGYVSKKQGTAGPYSSVKISFNSFGPWTSEKSSGEQSVGWR